MNEPHCRCPGCGECAAHRKEPGLKERICSLENHIEALVADRERLLDALKEMAHTFSKNHAPAVDAARAAIAKATGEQQ